MNLHCFFFDRSDDLAANLILLNLSLFAQNWLLRNIGL